MIKWKRPENYDSHWSTSNAGPFNITSFEGNGTRPDYLVNRAYKKMRGQSGKKIAQKSRNKCGLNGGGVKAHRQLTRASNGLSPGTKYKRSKNDFAVTSIALTLRRLGTRLLQLPSQRVMSVAIACCRVQPPDTASSDTCACCIMLGARLACTHLLGSCHQQRQAKEICRCAECARTALIASYALAADVLYAHL